ncbi:ELWxxDGT repeat protein [Vitiosangium sp. GDMCC 1.1324]|uniref:ELWxxDGT repeat protein n=1 Tax=Vitiosangium sp. (strain GDMCC 1.1324) TaxID=2138576 RepID=UPI000D390C60|nr:ELWxxDGT repeat protein [Vitiosangium sp. GDMCC 1.1324]PTL79981.1 hypothetical protein DAT35_31670 [Vitiosangium sp. GDMCC 1.1324]
MRSTPGPRPNDGNPDNFVEMDGILYFSANDHAGNELWRSDGTPEGTVLVKDVSPGSATSGLSAPTRIGETLFFIAHTPATGYELWKSDGSEAGTVMVKEIRSGTAWCDCNVLGAYQGMFYFVANDGVSGVDLWHSDGTPEGTVKVKDWPYDPSSGAIREPVQMNGILYFIRLSALWRTDGTDAGTWMVKQLISEPKRCQRT